MGLFDRLFGHRPAPAVQQSPRAPCPPAGGRAVTAADDRALQRYQYLARIAPPEAIEQAHADACAQLTPAQRRQLLCELAAMAPAHERAALARAAEDPQMLARLATRAEISRPGALEHLCAGSGDTMAGTVFTSLVAGVLGSVVARQLLADVDDLAVLEEGAEPWSDGDEMVAADEQDLRGSVDIPTGRGFAVEL